MSNQKRYSFTDDELLMFAVDDTPALALQAYIQRNFIDPRNADFENIRTNMKKAAKAAGLI